MLSIIIFKFLNEVHLSIQIAINKELHVSLQVGGKKQIFEL